MSEPVPMPSHYAPGPALPDPAAASGPTRWGAPARDHVTASDGSAPWADAVEHVVALPAVEPVTERVGWLTAARSDGPDAA